MEKHHAWFRSSLLLIVLLGVTTASYGQTTYALQPESNLWIDGTSNKSDWTVEAQEMTLDLAVDAADPFSVSSLTLDVASARIKSDKGAIMDRNMAKALKVTQHPSIVFSLTGASYEEGGTSRLFLLNVTGDLTLLGSTQPIEFAATGEALSDGAFRFMGSYTLNMTDYDMTPPTAMFGALRVGKEVTIRFDVIVAPGA